MMPAHQAHSGEATIEVFDRGVVDAVAQPGPSARKTLPYLLPADRRRPSDALPQVAGLRILRQMFEGTMSRIFEALDERLQRRVAVKVLSATGKALPMAVARL